MSTEFLNLNPHAVHLYAKDGTTLLRTFPASGGPALRLINNTPTEEEFLGLTTIPPPTYSGISGLPDPASYAGKPAPTIIVSTIAAEALARGKQYPGNVIVPDTSPQGGIRDEKGAITGTKRFHVYHRAE